MSRFNIEKFNEDTKRVFRDSAKQVFLEIGVKSVIRSEEFTTLDENGNSTYRTNIKTSKVPNEPSYVKAYVEMLGMMLNVGKCEQALFLYLANIMNYENEVNLTKRVKLEISEAIGYKINTINNALSALVNADLIAKLGGGDYIINPNIFAKGAWESIIKDRIDYKFAINTVIDKNGSRTTIQQFIEEKQKDMFDDVVGEIEIDDEIDVEQTLDILKTA